MQVPVQMTYRNMERSEAVEADIRKRLDRLSRHYDDIVSCRVILEAPMQRRQKGGLFKVRIDMTCPRGKLEVNREPDGRHHAHEDVYVALRDAFVAAERKLVAYAERRRKEVKLHEEPLYGRISHLSPMEEYGLITTPDQREIYFHRNSLLNGSFETLKLGTQVDFREEEGDEGPQAASVKIVG